MEPEDGGSNIKPRGSRTKAGLLSSDVPGLDDVLGGGIEPHRLCLVEGTPGAGKTTIALQFLLEGAQRGESVLYVTLSETATETELRGVADCELARRLRADPAHHGLLLVVLTGWGQPDDRVRIAQAGFDHHLLKPVDVEELSTALRQLAQRDAGR